MGRGQPEGVFGVELGVDLFTFLTLPVPEILLGEIFLDMGLGHHEAGLADRIGGLVGALQVGGHQKRVGRQEPRQGFIGRWVVDVSQRVGISIDATPGGANRSVANPPPACT